MKARIIAIGLLAGVLAFGQSVHAAPASQRSSRATTFTHRHHAVETKPRPVTARPEVTGVIPRAIRGGYPLQMLNPFAPAKYGAAEQNVVLDPSVPGRADGIKLFSFTF